MEQVKVPLLISCAAILSQHQVTPPSTEYRLHRSPCVLKTSSEWYHRKSLSTKISTRWRISSSLVSFMECLQNNARSAQGRYCNLSDSMNVEKILSKTF